MNAGKEDNSGSPDPLLMLSHKDRSIVYQIRDLYVNLADTKTAELRDMMTVLEPFGDHAKLLKNVASGIFSYRVSFGRFIVYLALVHIYVKRLKESDDVLCLNYLSDHITLRLLALQVLAFIQNHGGYKGLLSHFHINCTSFQHNEIYDAMSALFLSLSFVPTMLV